MMYELEVERECDGVRLKMQMQEEWDNILYFLEVKRKRNGIRLRTQM
jgi:hypothetical protein